MYSLLHKTDYGKLFVLYGRLFYHLFTLNVYKIAFGVSEATWAELYKQIKNETLQAKIMEKLEIGKGKFGSIGKISYLFLCLKCTC